MAGRRKSLVDQVTNELRTQIINLKIKPGEPLNELHLIKKLGVSRSPLREAYRILESEGLVERNSGRGVNVKKISANDVLELFPVRAALEGLAAELAARRLTNSELEHLRKITEEMEIAVKQKDINEYQKLNFKFHKAIVKGARNSRLENQIKILGRQSIWMSFASMYFKESSVVAMDSHREIYEALKKGDAELSKKLISSHINNGGMMILKNFS